MSSKLSKAHKEQLSLQQKRIVGIRPYENGKFGTHQGDFIMFELLDATGNIISWKHLPATEITENTPTSLALWPSTHIEQMGYSSGIFKVRYHFLRRVAGDNISVLVKTKPLESVGEIYPTTNNFHITEDGLIFEGTEEDWQQSSEASVPLKIEDLKYKIDSISPSRTEVRLTAKNIKGAYQQDFYKAQEQMRYRSISEGTIEFDESNENIGANQSKIIIVDSGQFLADTISLENPDGGFYSRMVGGRFTIPNVYKTGEKITKVRTNINLIPNPSGERLTFSAESGQLAMGLAVNTNWDETLHSNAVKPESWESGFYDFLPTGGTADWDGTEGVGFHAHWVQGEGVDGGVCLKFPDTNLAYIEDPNWHGDEHRPLWCRSNALSPLNGINAQVGDKINISFDMRATSVGKGVRVALRYAQQQGTEEMPTGKLIYDINGLEIGNADPPPNNGNPPTDPAYTANTEENAENYESKPSNDSRDFDDWYYIGAVGDHSDETSNDGQYSLGGNGYWKIDGITTIMDQATDSEYDEITWVPILHHEKFGGAFSRDGLVQGDWTWQASTEEWISTLPSSDEIDFTPIAPVNEAPANPPVGFVPNTTAGAGELESVPSSIIAGDGGLVQQGVNVSDIEVGATSLIAGGEYGAWKIDSINQAESTVEWGVNSQLLSGITYTKKNSLSEDGEWVWDGIGTWSPIILAPDYFTYANTAHALLSLNYTREGLNIENNPALLLPVIDTDTGTNIAVNYYDANQSTWNGLSATLTSNIDNTQFSSPESQYNWNGTEWIAVFENPLSNYEYVIGREGMSIEVPANTANEWERIELQMEIPLNFRLDLQYQLGFYGHDVGPQQGVTWVDNVFMDVTYENQTTTEDIMSDYKTTITEIINSETIRVEDSWEDGRLKVYGEENSQFNTGQMSNGYDRAKLSYTVNNPYDLRTYLKFDNQLFLTTNFKKESIATPDYPNSIVYKLYRPLPDSFKRFDEVTIVKEMMDPITDSVKIVDFIDTDVGNVVLKTPDMNNITHVERKQVEYKSETDILTSDKTISKKLRNEFISQSFESVEINTDYGQFKNFINFSSVEKRIRNFKYKLELLESYSDSSGSLDGISGSFDDGKVWQTKIDDIKNNFDEFESYMYHKSSSRSSGSLGIFYSNAWPKTGGSGSVQYPYELAHTTSSQATTWFSEQVSSASIYDTENMSRLSTHIPDHISDDSENLDYVNFIDMIAQHFDSIWLYAKAITDTYDRREKLDEGISKELLYTMAKSLGWHFADAKDLVSLPRYAYGVEVTGSSYSDYSAVSDRDISREIWSRMINNLPFFLKNKGTIKALKGLINIYGIPSTILRVKEYGGPSLPDSSEVPYEITRKFTKALDFRSGQYIRTAWTDDGFTSRKPDTIEFRFRTATGSDQILIEKQSTTTDQDWVIRLKDNNSTDNYGYVSFMLSSSAVGTSVGQYKELTSSAMPVYDGDFYSVMVQRSSGSDNPNISQSYELHVGKYDAGMSRINLYSKSTMNVDVAASASFNLAWTGSGDVYIGGQSDITGTGIRLSGSIMEYRHWTEALQTSSFRNHIANPKAYDGNSISSSYKHLTLRYSFDDNQDLSSYTAGILDSRAEQEKAVSGSYVGFTGNFYRNVVDELKTNIPSIGALNRSGKKIRLEDNNRVYGNLNANHRVTLGSFDNAPLDSNRVGVYFAPTDVINTDIINSVANLNFDNYLGDPRDSYEQHYRGLEYVADNYWKKYNSPNDFWDYIRMLKYYDQSMFPQIKKMIPARAKARVGVLVEPNIFERPKIIKGRDPKVETPYYSSSIDFSERIFITSSYNAAASITNYDAYTGRIPVYSYDTGSVTVTTTGSYLLHEASGSEIRDRFTQGTIWTRLNNNDAFYSHSTITFGDTKYTEALQPNITGSRMLGRNQKIRKFYSSSISASEDKFYSSSFKNSDIDNKAVESEALFNLFYAGVKNTKRTTIDGELPVEVVITAPTKLVTQKTAESSLKTGHGKKSDFKNKETKKEGKVIEKGDDGSKSFKTSDGVTKEFDSIDDLTKDEKDELTKNLKDESNKDNGSK